MSKQSNTTEADGLYPIRTVSELTGVNSVTLRAWERRYGLLEPVRKESGHRLYTQQHIDLINRVVGLLDRGMRIGEVKPHLELRQSRREQNAAGRTDDAWQRYQDRMVAAVIQFNEEGLEEAYGDALANHPAARVTERLLAPLLVELGERWENGEGTIAEEHFFSSYLRNKLGARFHHRVRPQHGPRLLLACLPDDRHETGLLLFGLAASDAGFRIIMLGPDMPLTELPAAADKTDCDAIVLSGLQKPGRKVLASLLPELVESVAVPVLVGGRASVEAHGEIKKAGASPLGTDIPRSLEALRQVLLH